MDIYYSGQTLENVIVIAGRDHRGDCQEQLSCSLVCGLHSQGKKQIRLAIKAVRKGSGEHAVKFSFMLSGKTDGPT